MTAKQLNSNSALFDEEGFDADQEAYELLQEEAELELHLDMHHRTPARLSNEFWN